MSVFLLVTTIKTGVSGERSRAALVKNNVLSHKVSHVWL